MEPRVCARWLTVRVPRLRCGVVFTSATAECLPLLPWLAKQPHPDAYAESLAHHSRSAQAAAEATLAGSAAHTRWGRIRGWVNNVRSLAAQGMTSIYRWWTAPPPVANFSYLREVMLEQSRARQEWVRVDGERGVLLDTVFIPAAGE